MKFLIGQKVEKIGGDYQFDGEVVAVFTKRDKNVRLVVEDDRGVCLIFAPRNLQAKTETAVPKQNVLEVGEGPNRIVINQASPPSTIPVGAVVEAYNVGYTDHQRGLARRIPM